MVKKHFIKESDLSDFFDNLPKDKRTVLIHLHKKYCYKCGSLYKEDIGTCAKCNNDTCLISKFYCARINTINFNLDCIEFNDVNSAYHSVETMEIESISYTDGESIKHQYYLINI